MRRLAWLLFLALLSAAPLAAQEVQVPLDEEGRVMTADRALAQRLGLWLDEYPGFQEARLFSSGDTYVLEISRLRDGTLLRDRLPQTAAQVAELRRRVSALLLDRAELDERGELNREGRYLLLGQTTLAGVAFYGWALPLALDVENSAAGGLYLLTAASSFFLPFALTESAPVTFGMANLSRYGVTRGVAHGLLLYNLIDGEPERRQVCNEFGCYEEYDGDDDDRGYAASGMALSVVEGVAGYLWARNERMTAGTANAIALGGDAGLFWGLSTAAALGTEDSSERSTAAIALPAAIVGIAAGHRLARARDFTWGDVDVVYTGGAVGVLSGFALAEAITSDDPDDFEDDSEEDERVYAALGLAGSAAGVFLADRLVRNTDFSVGQASLNRLGSLAGALAGASLGVMAESGTTAFIGAAVGGVAGYALTYVALAPQAPAGRGERMPSSPLEVGIDPRGGVTLRYRF